MSTEHYVYILYTPPKNCHGTPKTGVFLASKTLFRMGSKLPGISNHFHIDSGMKPETCHMSLCLMQRYSYTLFKTYQNCQRAMHMVCWIYCLPSITNNCVPKGRGWSSEILIYSIHLVSACVSYISPFTLTYLKRFLGFCGISQTFKAGTTRAWNVTWRLFAPQVGREKTVGWKCKDGLQIGLYHV